MNAARALPSTGACAAGVNKRVISTGATVTTPRNWPLAMRRSSSCASLAPPATVRMRSSSCTALNQLAEGKLSTVLGQLLKRNEDAHTVMQAQICRLASAPPSGVFALRKSCSDTAISASRAGISSKSWVALPRRRHRLVHSEPSGSGICARMSTACTPAIPEHGEDPLETILRLSADLAERDAELTQVRQQLTDAQTELAVVSTRRKPAATMMFKQDFPTLCGVIGGVGPEASADFLLNGVIKGRAKLFRHLREAASAGEQDLESVARHVSSAPWSASDLSRLEELACPEDHTLAFGDQQHVPLLMYDNPQIPDRTAFILREEGDEHVADPGPALAASGMALVEAGANLICVVCNTAHYFLPDLRAAMPEGVQVLHMLELTVLHALRLHTAKFQRDGPLLRLGLLATTGTCATGIYATTAADVGRECGVEIQVLTPSEVEGGSQSDVHDRCASHSSDSSERSEAYYSTPGCTYGVRC
jgi:aspartate/glutamate racemase